MLNIMISGISRYRCKCGVSIQVVSETDKARIDQGIRLEVECPECKENQVIYAHRITKIAVELPAKAPK